MTSSFLLGRHPLSSATTFGEFEVFGKSVGFYLLNLRRHIFAYFVANGQILDKPSGHLVKLPVSITKHYATRTTFEIYARKAKISSDSSTKAATDFYGNKKCLRQIRANRLSQD